MPTRPPAPVAPKPSIIVKKTLRVLLRIMGWTAALASVAGCVLVFVGMKLHGDYERRAAAFDLAKMGEVSQRSAVYDVNSEIYSYLHGENRMVIPLDAVSGWFIQALLAREDARFWEHDGLDYKGMVRAAVTNFRAGEVRQGASTLTQQLARNALELNTESYDRKALEAVLSQRIERSLTKPQILEMYLNRIYFGSGFYGLETASRGYFGKPASELNLSESALLAAIIRSPNRLSPRRNLKGALADRNVVLDRMTELHMIRQEEAAAAKAMELVVNHDNPLHFQEDYVMEAVNRDLAAIVSPDVIELGGLKIYTTIDPELQQAALRAADEALTKIEEGKNYPHPKKADFVPGQDEKGVEKPTDYLQAALVAVDNRTGAVRALVGGRDYTHSKYSRAILSRRQIGSTFKPFVYAAAFKRGMLPGTLVSDDAIGPNELRQVSKKKWAPENSDGEYSGLQPASWGLVKSRNTMAIRVGEFAGVQSVHQLANELGIGEAMLDLPVSHLGAFETTLRQLTAAYTVFPNSGVHRPAHLISRVEDTGGKVLYEAKVGDKQVIPAAVAWMTSTALQDVMKSGTAAKAISLGWRKPSGGKTGTTNDFFDAWFVGYTSSVTCGVWVGMDKPQTILEKGYGSALALPIWVNFMKSLPEKTYPAAKLPVPAQLVQTTLCTTSGARANTQCVHQLTSYRTILPSDRIPVQVCTVHTQPAPLYAAQPFAGTALPATRSPEPFSALSTPPAAAPTSRAPAATPSASTSITIENGVEIVGRGGLETPEERALREKRRDAHFAAAGSAALTAAGSRPVRRAVAVEDTGRMLPPERVYRAEPALNDAVRVRRAIPVN